MSWSLNKVGFGQVDSAGGGEREGIPGIDNSLGKGPGVGVMGLEQLSTCES